MTTAGEMRSGRRDGGCAGTSRLRRAFGGYYQVVIPSRAYEAPQQRHHPIERITQQLVGRPLDRDELGQI